jgi:hypothetical protein
MAVTHDITWPLAVTLLLIGATAGVCILAILIGGRGPGVRERDSGQRDTETGSFKG